MEDFLIELLNNVGYEGPLLDRNVATESILAGPSNESFQDLIIWLTDEIRGLGSVEEKIVKSEDAITFIMELSGFMKELMCPYAQLTTGHATERLQSLESKHLLIEYLVTELMAFKMCEYMKPKEKSNVITLTESPTAAALKDVSIVLSLGKPPNNISTKALFEKLNVRLDETMRTVGKERVGNPFFAPSKNLTNEQWAKLDKIHGELDTEYDLRRKMMLTRLDVTIQSFKWKENTKGKGGQISEKYAEKRKLLESLQTGGSNTDIAALMAARDTLTIIEKCASASVRKNTKSKIQRHIIGMVPDRGGRADEHNPPPPEMPSWQKRNDGGGQRGGRGGGGGRGGFQQQNQQGRGGYDNNRSSGFDNRGAGNPYQSYQQQPNSGTGYQQNRGGGSRVQGGWAAPQKDIQGYSQNNQGYNQGGNQGYGQTTQGYNQGNQGGYNQQYDNNDNRGGGGSSRGRSNYNRGGRR